jgi:hypothetical protein
MIKMLRLTALSLLLLFFVTGRTYSREIVYVQLNRQVFVSGETICFSARLVDQGSQDQTGGSVIYLQMTNADGREFFVVRSDSDEKGLSYGCIGLPDSLATGLYYLTAYSNCMRNYDPGQLYFSPIIILNRFENIDQLDYFDAAETKSYPHKSPVTGISEKSSPEIEIKTSDDLFGSRQKVVISLSLKGLEDISSADISVSVSEIVPSPLLRNASLDMRSFITAGEDSHSKAEKANSKKGDQSCRYLPEDEGFILSGTVTDDTSGMVLQNACVFLSTPDSIANLKYSITDSTGRFYFLLDRCCNNKKLILQTKHDANYHGNAEIHIDNKSIGKTNAPPEKVNVDDSLRTFLQNCLTINLINNSFPKDNSNSAESAEKSTCIRSGCDFFGKPDRVIYPSDFSDLPDFNEIISNLLPYARFRSDKNDNYTIQLPSNETHLYLSDENAMVLLNNIPLFEYSLLNNMNSKQISKIVICQRLMMYGDLQISGILSLFTNDDYLPFLTDGNKVIQVNNDVRARDKGRQVSGFEGKEQLKTGYPDLRQTIYWNPEMKIDGNDHTIEFYTSDLKAAYEINVQGFTGDGKPVCVTKIINVK